MTLKWHSSQTNKTSSGFRHQLNKQDQLALTTGCDKICSLVLGLCEAVRQGILFIVYACVDVLSKSYVINFKELCNPRTPPYQMGGVGGGLTENLCSRPLKYLPGKESNNC